MQTPVEIAFRYCEPSDEIRSEIAAQVQRLEKFSPRITSCRVVVNGPQSRHRRGDLFQVGRAVFLYTSLRCAFDQQFPIVEMLLRVI